MLGLQVSKEEIEEAIQKATTYNEVALNLGRFPGQYFIKQLKQWIVQYKIDDKHLLINVSKSRWSIESVMKAVSESTSYTDALVALGVKHRSGNFNTLKQKIAQYGISTAHFDSIAAGISKKLLSGNLNTIPLDEILNGNHPSYKTTLLKQRLIKEGIKDYKCEGTNCGLSKWHGKPITLELDHINGISDDHRLCNLRLLCPNCHSQTKTFKGRNKHRGAFE